MYIRVFCIARLFSNLLLIITTLITLNNVQYRSVTQTINTLNVRVTNSKTTWLKVQSGSMFEI